MLAISTRRIFRLSNVTDALRYGSATVPAGALIVTVVPVNASSLPTYNFPSGYKMTIPFGSVSSIGSRSCVYIVATTFFPKSVSTVAPGSAPTDRPAIIVTTKKIHNRPNERTSHP